MENEYEARTRRLSADANQDTPRRPRDAGPDGYRQPRDPEREEYRRPRDPEREEYRQPRDPERDGYRQPRDTERDTPRRPREGADISWDDYKPPARRTMEFIEKALEEKQAGKSHSVRKRVIKAVLIALVIAASAILLTTLLFPIVQVQNESMMPTLNDGERLIFTTIGEVGIGDIVAFDLGNRTMVKRVIAEGGQWISIDEQGAVYVDDVRIDEPYLAGPGTNRQNGRQVTALRDVSFPFLVPDNHFFVMGDNREVSLDSRRTDFGTVHKDGILGKALFRIWPIDRFGTVGG